MAELDDQQLLDKVITSLEEQLHIEEITKVASGNEFCILRGELPSGVIAIKVPRDRVFSNVNDAYIDSQVLLDQEFAIMHHLKAQGITQIPEPINHLKAAGFGALVMSYVPSDGSKPDEYELGRLLAKLHSVQPPDLELSAQEGRTIPELVDKRMARRRKELAVFVPDLPGIPGSGIIAKALEEIVEVKQLLHMDFREANLRVQNGKVVAVVDWSNALLGHPAMELARIAETGETGERFLEGYASITSLPRVSPLVETIFRLDTAIMLALVFLSEEPDPERAPTAIKRVRELHTALLNLIEK